MEYKDYLISIINDYYDKDYFRFIRNKIEDFRLGTTRFNAKDYMTLILVRYFNYNDPDNDTLDEIFSKEEIVYISSEE